jgi:hypothetical protein
MIMTYNNTFSSAETHERGFYLPVLPVVLSTAGEWIRGRLE